jgi:hypothetical protein
MTSEVADMISSAHNKKNSNIIKNIPLFSELSDEETRKIEGMVVKKNFPGIR